MHENDDAALGPEANVGAALTASRELVAITARSLADGGEEVALTQYRSLVGLASRGPQSVAALPELAESAGEVPEQDWSSGWDL